MADIKVNRVTNAAVYMDGNSLLGRAERVADDYAGRFAAHRAGLAEIARRAGWSFAHHTTDRPAEAALLALYAVISQRPD